MDILSVILGVPGIARRRQTEVEPEAEPHTVSAVETQTVESSKPRTLFSALRQKLLSLVGK
jgi:hypothetical protein